MFYHQSLREGVGLMTSKTNRVTYQGVMLGNVAGIRCKTCTHITESRTFVSNVTGRKYNTISSELTMTCNTDNVVYLISCRKCGIQYVGETSQVLRRRMNNHRNRLKNLGEQYLYKHFCSDGHSIADLSIMPIEQVEVSDTDNVTVNSKRLAREQYWYKELNSIYPHGLNDNVKSVGNMSRKNNDINVWSLFNTKDRKYRKRPLTRSSRHNRQHHDVESDLQKLLSTYKSLNFCNDLRKYVFFSAEKADEYINLFQ